MGSMEKEPVGSIAFWRIKRRTSGRGKDYVELLKRRIIGELWTKEGGAFRANLAGKSNNRKGEEEPIMILMIWKKTS